MSTAHLAGAQPRRPNSGRKPLQPTNYLPIKTQTKPQKLFEINSVNKENPHSAIHIEPMIDGSLAEELSAMRKRAERLREEREKTEGVMRERGMVLERMMKEIIERGEVQRQVEIEVDRVFRLNEIKLQSKRNSPRSLREKEHGGRTREAQPQGLNTESTSECTSGSQPQNSSSEIHTEN